MLKEAFDNARIEKWKVKVVSALQKLASPYHIEQRATDYSKACFSCQRIMSVRNVLSCMHADTQSRRGHVAKYKVEVGFNKTLAIVDYHQNYWLFGIVGLWKKHFWSLVLTKLKPDSWVKKE